MKRLEYNHIKEIEPFIRKYGYNEYNCNIVTLLMWKDLYEFYYEVHEHFLVGYWQYLGKIRWMMPLCEEKYFKEAMDYILNYSKTHNIKFSLEAVVEPFVNLLKKYYPEHTFIYRLEENAGDYIYDVSQHATLKGKKMQKRRNHYNAFIKEYNGRFEYVPYKKEMKENVLFFLNNWKEEHHHKDDIEEEIKGISQLLDHYDELKLFGGVFYIDNKISGFTLASKLYDNTLQIHVEKVNHHIRGLYVALLKSFLNEHLEYHFMNREDDLGLPELRKAKMDLQPLYRVIKYAVELNNIKLIRPNDTHTNEIKQLWLECFEDENTNSTEFYFNHLYHKDYTYAIEYNQHIIAAMQIKPMKLKVGEKEIDTHFIVGVCTQKMYRGNGLMRIMMEKAIDDHRNDAFLILQAYNWDIYKTFNFNEKYFHKIAIIKDKFEDITQNVYNFKFGYNTHLMLESYKRFTSCYEGYCLRDVSYYDEYFIPYHQNENHKTIFVFQDDECLGYIVYELLEDHIYVHEMTIKNNDALKVTLNELLDEIQNIKVRMPIQLNLNSNEQIIANMAIRYQDETIQKEIEGLSSKLFINEIL